MILIDTGAGISPNVLSFTRCADQVLVVTTPEPTAITDAYAVIKVISRDAPDRPLSLLVNQVRRPGEGRLVYERIAKVARQFLSRARAGCRLCSVRSGSSRRGAPADAVSSGQPALPGQPVHQPAGHAPGARRRAAVAMAAGDSSTA